MDQVIFFKGCLPQILLGPFFNTLTHLNQGQYQTLYWHYYSRPNNPESPLLLFNSDESQITCIGRLLFQDAATLVLGSWNKSNQNWSTDI